MDLLTRTELEDLARVTEGPCVSLYLPTHRAGRETEGDPLRFRTLLSGAESALQADGVPAEDVAELLAPAWELHGDVPAWQHMSDGLAVFLSGGRMRSFRLPMELPELVTVGEHHTLGPVLPLLGDEQFLVLALSKRQVRLLQGSRLRVEQLEVPAVPDSFEDVFAPDEARTDSVARPVSPGRTGPAVFYGTAGPDGTEKRQELTEFLREVADGVYRHVGARNQPMVLAGLPDSVSAYREVNHYRHVLDDVVDHNPDDLDAAELHESAWAIIADRLRHADEEEVDRLQQARPRGHGTLDLGEALAAAQQGRVDTLLVSGEAGWPVGPTSQVVRLAERDDVRQLVDDAARATLCTGGAVRVLEHLPEGAPAAAVLRY